MGSSIRIPVFCFLLVFNYIATENFVEFTFDAIPLGHSGILLTWKPNITTQTEETWMELKYLFKFESSIIEEKSNESNGNNKFDDNQKHSSARKNNENSESDDNESDSSVGQYKIHSLKENTPYNVTIKQYSRKNRMTSFKEYCVKMRTNLKSQKIPAKPYFELEPIADEVESKKRVRWYPCGKERICNDQESGTHFGITIKEPYNTRRLSEVKKEEFFKDHVDIQFWPGIYYEVVVYSVYGDCKTDSDSREIFLKPVFTQVQYVNIISLPDSSALISWKPPKQFVKEPLKLYWFYHFTFSAPDIDIQDQMLLEEDIPDSVRNRMKLISSEFEQIRIFNLEPEIRYTYIILPMSEDGWGFQYRTMQKFQVCDQDLPIAEPDFNYKFEKDDNNRSTCNFYFQWLPCGQSFNCENTKPGSNYAFHFEPEPPEKIDIKKNGYYGGTFDMGPVYYVTVNSSIGNNFSESVTKMFKDCKILENIP